MILIFIAKKGASNRIVHYSDVVVLGLSFSARTKCSSQFHDTFHDQLVECESKHLKDCLYQNLVMLDNLSYINDFQKFPTNTSFLLHKASKFNCLAIYRTRLILSYCDSCFKIAIAVSPATCFQPQVFGPVRSKFQFP